MDVACGDRRPDRTAGLVFVTAIAEAALGQQRPEFAESHFDFAAAQMRKAEFLQARAVDDGAVAI